LHARCPYDQFRWNDLPTRKSDTIRQDLGDARRRPDPHTFALQELGRGVRKTLRYRWQDPIGRLNHVELDVPVRIDPIEPIRHQFACCVVQLGGQLYAGGPGTDDRHLQLLWAKRFWLRMCAHEGVDKPTMKALCLAGCLKRDRVLLDAGSTNIVGETADCEHQRVVMEHTLRCDLAALLIDD